MICPAHARDEIHKATSRCLRTAAIKSASNFKCCVTRDCCFTSSAVSGVCRNSFKQSRKERLVFHRKSGDSPAMEIVFTVTQENDGGYGGHGFVFQSPAALPDFDGNHPVFGVWVVDHEAAGLGIREDTRRITGNLSRFVPHFFT